MDALYIQLQRMKSRPGMYLSRKDLYALQDYIMGYSTDNEGLIRYNSISGFNDYVAEHFHDSHSLNFASIIHSHANSAEAAFKIFYQLYEEYVQLREKRGIPDDPPPHFQLGGIYRYDKKGKQYYVVILDYEDNIYLVAVTDSEDGKTSILVDKKVKRWFSLGWVFVPAMVYPADVEIIGNIDLYGEYSDIGRLQLAEKSYFIEYIADEKMWENNGNLRIKASIKDISSANAIKECIRATSSRKSEKPI